MHGTEGIDGPRNSDAGINGNWVKYVELIHFVVI